MAAASDAAAVVAGWVLSGDPGDGEVQQFPLQRSPFRIGRQPGSDLRLRCPEASRLHAEIIEHRGELWLRDCGSTNGTFINQRQVLQQQTLTAGDVIRFGPLSFRLTWQPQTAAGTKDTLPTAILASDPLPDLGRQTAKERFDSMLQQRSVVPFFQPVRRLGDGGLAGYEILGRCTFDGLPRQPSQALRAAGSAEQEIELSELFRETGLRQALQLGNRHALFLNAAPSEVEPFRLAVSLTTLRHHAPDLPLVLEVNEAAHASQRMLRELRALLDDLNVELAYDDFGVGQTRLLEIVSVPPDWLKFDMLLVQSLRHQPDKAWVMLRTLVGMAHDLGIKTVAEGIETEADLSACEALGFDAGQGYHIGRPLPFLAPE